MYVYKSFYFALFLNSFIEVSFAFHKIHSCKMYNAVSFSKLTKLCSHHDHPFLQHFCHSDASYPCIVTSCFHPQPQAPTNVHCVSVCLFWTSHVELCSKWSFVSAVFYVFLRFICVVACVSISPLILYLIF